MPGMDFNGDGLDDVLLQNFQTGVVSNWLGQSDGSFFSNHAVAQDPWAIGAFVGWGDFNSDGLTDTLWRTASGELFSSVTFADGAFFFQWSLGFVTKLPTTWYIAATGDFDGDGEDDILWRNETGALSEWLGVGNGYSFTWNAAAAQQLPPDWFVAGTGDFNRDGQTDILWRNASGALSEWLAQDNGSFAWNAAATQLLSTDWQLVGTGDFNGDSRTDLMWRNSAGALSEWLAQDNGSFAWNPAIGYQIPTDWQVAGTGDYNGDGRDDLLWRRSDGVVTNWLAQGNGDFVSNHDDAWYALSTDWTIHPNLSGAGAWDYF